MSLEKLIAPLGISAYLLLLITFISGLRGIKVQNHKLIAFIAVGLATLHACLIIYLK